MIWFWRDTLSDHLLFLVQKLLQSIQEKAETLVTKVINPTERTNTYKYDN